MKTILFVDDQPAVRERVRALLAPLQQEWRMEFVSNGQEALTKLAQGPVDVVISDLRLRGMDGAQLLSEVRAQYPHILRIIVSDQDRETTLQSVAAAHQCLPKACSADVVRSTVERACAVQELLGNATLRNLVGGMQTLPSLPTLYRELMQELQSSDPSIDKAAKIVSQDMAMVTKILQVINSPFYGLRKQVSSAAQAVALLGLDSLKSLVLSMKVFSQFEAHPQSFFSLEALWRHGMATSRRARQIAKDCATEPRVIEDTFTAGLLHDMGLLVLAINVPDQYRETVVLMQDRGISEWASEREILGATHADVGGYLLGIWGLSDPIVEAVAFHHEPGRSRVAGFSPLAALHVANVLEEQEQEQAAGFGEGRVEFDTAYLSQCGLLEHLTRWQNVGDAAPGA